MAFARVDVTPDVSVQLESSRRRQHVVKYLTHRPDHLESDVYVSANHELFCRYI